MKPSSHRLYIIKDNKGQKEVEWLTALCYCDKHTDHAATMQHCVEHDVVYYLECEDCIQEMIKGKKFGLGGNVCEEHPDKPWGHDGCRGAGRKK